MRTAPDCAAGDNARREPTRTYTATAALRPPPHHRHHNRPRRPSSTRQRRHLAHQFLYKGVGPRWQRARHVQLSIKARRGRIESFATIRTFPRMGASRVVFRAAKSPIRGWRARYTDLLICIRRRRPGLRNPALCTRRSHRPRPGVAAKRSQYPPSPWPSARCSRLNTPGLSQLIPRSNEIPSN